MRRLAGRVVPVLLAVLVVVAIAAITSIVSIKREPVFWQRYWAARKHGGHDLPPSFFEPREQVVGGNMAPAPRVSPDLEMLDVNAMVEASHYAAAHGSRALIVTRHGHIVFERYWGGTGFDTLDDSQTMSRTLAALLVGIAIGDRKIGWPDEPIGNFIPEWKNDPRGAITVRNLMQLSSGLAPGGSTANPWGAAARAQYGTDVQAAALSRGLAGKPGETWADQAADPQLLAQVIERATKDRYADYLSVELWRKLGAADAWLWLDRTGGTAHVDCCFLARQGDWIRVGELLSDNGRYQGDEIVPPGWVAQLLQPAKSNPKFGASLRITAEGIASEPYALKDVFLVDARGYRLWLVPSMKLVILRSGPEIQAGSDWDDARIPNMIIRSARDYVPPQARPGSDLKNLVPNH